MSNPFDNATPIDPSNPFDVAQPIQTTAKQTNNPQYNDVGAGNLPNKIPMMASHTPSLTMMPSHAPVSKTNSSTSRAGYTPGALDTLNPADVDTSDVDASRAYGQATTMGAIQGTARLISEPLHALGIIGDQTYNRTQNRAANATQIKQNASNNPNLNPIDAMGMSVISNPYTYLTAPFAPGASTVSQLGFGAGLGALYSATEPNSTVGSTLGGALTGLGTAGLIKGVHTALTGGMGGQGAATVADQIGKSGPVQAAKETPNDVMNAWQNDNKLPSAVYSPNALHEMAEGGNPLAQQYEARLNVATTNEYNSITGKELPINAGNINKSDRAVGTALSNQVGSGVAAHNQAQGEAIHTFLDTAATNHNIAANSAPFDFEGPDATVNIDPNSSLQKSINKANLSKSNSDNIAVSLTGTLADKTAISRQNYQRVSDEINLAQVDDPTLPKGPDLSKVVAYDSEGKAVGTIPDLLQDPYIKNDEAIGRTVHTWQTKLLNNDLSYQDTKAVQSQIESDIRSLYRNNNPDLMPKIRAYSILADAVGKAADDYASVVIPNSTAPQDAANYFRENIPAYRNAKEGITQILKGVDNDTTTNKLYGANKADQLDRIFPLLDSRGQEALRSEFLDRAIKSGAQQDGTYNVQATTNYLNQRDSQLGTLFGGVDEAGNGTNPIKNIVNFARTSPNATLLHTPGVGIPDILSSLGKGAAKTAVGAGVGSAFGPYGAAAGSLLGANSFINQGADIASNMYRGHNFLHPNIEGIAQDAPLRQLTAGFPTLSDRPAIPTQPSPIPGQASLGMSTPSGGQLNTPKYGPVPTPTNQGIYPAQPMPTNQIRGTISGGNGPAALSMAERPSLSTLGMAPRPATPMPATTNPGQVTPLGPLKPTYSAYPLPTKYNAILGSQDRGWEGIMLDNLARRNKIRSEEEYKALPTGAPYEAADGTKGIKE
jgi:hypothetical protein